MVDRICKTLQKLSKKDLVSVIKIITLISCNDLGGLDIKKLQGRDDVYRVRKGDFRVIFRRVSDAESMIIAIERRSDTTYNDF